MLWRGPMGGGAASGKIGAMIASHCAQGQYLKTRVKCVNPRTELQHPLRNALRSLASMWGTTLTPTQRASWTTYAANVTWVNRLGDTVHLSGQMEFCRSNWPRFQIGLPLVLDGPVIFDRGSTGGGTITIGVGNDFGVFAIQAAPPWQDGSTLTACMVYMGLPRSAARTFMAPRTQLSAVLLGTFGGLTAFPPLQPRGNVAQYNQAYPSWLVATFSDGRLTTPTPLTPVFTGTPPVVFWTEDFPYPDGPLGGNGFWDTSINPDILILAETAQTEAGSNGFSTNDDPTIDADLSLPFSLIINFELQSNGDPAVFGNASLSLDTGSRQLYVNIAPSAPGPSFDEQQIQFQLGLTGASPATSTLIDFPIDEVHQIRVDVDGTTASLYLDGALQVTSTSTAASGSPTATLTAASVGGNGLIAISRLRTQSLPV